MVFYDGEKMCVQLNKRSNYKNVLELAKNYEFQFLHNESIFVFPPIKRIAKQLKEAGFLFDNSALIFLQDRVKKNKLELPNELYNFQKEGVEKMLAMEGNILLADEMGLGKTIQAIIYLQQSKKLPALVISPSSLKLNWKKEVEKWTDYKVCVLSGFTPYPLEKNYDVYIINYDILGMENKEEKIKELERRKKAKARNQRYVKKTIKVNGWCDELSKLDFGLIIADEVQYIAGEETIRTRAVVQICNNQKKAKKLFISGTPYETKTSQFYTALSILNSYEFNNRYKFKMRYCDPIKTFFGWKFDGLSNADELYEKISKFMIRRKKSEVLKELPEKIRSIIPLEVTEQEKKLYNDVDLQFYEDIKSGVKNKSQQIGHISHLKQVAFEAKKNAVIKWIKEFLFLHNQKLVVFVYHLNAYNLLMEEFKDIAVGINGKTLSNERQKIVDSFQDNEKIKLFVGQIKASGVGLTLNSASAVCFVEFGSTSPQHEQAEDRVHRIGQEADSVFAYYLILDNSIENDIMMTLERRNKHLKKVMDNEDNASLFGEEDLKKNILVEYKKRKGLED